MAKSIITKVAVVRIELEGPADAIDQIVKDPRSIIKPWVEEGAMIRVRKIKGGEWYQQRVTGEQLQQAIAETKAAEHDINAPAPAADGSRAAEGI
jgi:hypothetical protein